MGRAIAYPTGSKLREASRRDNAHPSGDCTKCLLSSDRVSCPLNSKPQTWENERKNKGFSLREPGVFTIGLRTPTIVVGEAIS